MVRTYKKKKLKELSQGDLEKAVNDVMTNKSTLRAAARKYSINLSTLYYRIVKNKEYALSREKDTGPYKRRIFTPDEEAILSRYFVNYSNMNYGISYAQIRMLAYVYAKSLDRQVPDSWDARNCAGLDWLTNFLNRVNCNLSIVKSNNAHRRSAPLNVDFFCNTIERALQPDDMRACRIYNLCEIEAFLDVPDHNEEQAEAQSLSVTMCAIANASADLLPPVFVFPLNEMDPSLLQHTPPDSLCLPNVHNSGILNTDHIIPILKHLQEHSNCTKDKPIILLLDNLVSQCTCTMDISAFCADNGITLISFPPNWAKSKQPLESNIMGTFKKAFASRKNEIHSVGPSLLHDLTSLISSSYLKAFTKSSIVLGFEKCHIWPLSKQALRDSTLKGDHKTNTELLDEKIDILSDNKQRTNEKDLLRIKWKSKKEGSTDNSDNQFVIVICEDGYASVKVEHD